MSRGILWDVRLHCYCFQNIMTSCVREHLLMQMMFITDSDIYKLVYTYKKWYGTIAWYIRAIMSLIMIYALFLV